MEKKVWFHGRNNPSTDFSYDYVGKGNDQEGAGFYFTDSYETAWGYTDGHGIVIRAYLNYRKLVPTTGKIKPKDIEFLIRNAPEYLETLQNWDENPNRAMMQAIKGYLEYRNNPSDAFQTVEADFYRGHPDLYLKSLVKLGYDGHMAEYSSEAIFYTNQQHMIVYNPAIIQIIDVEEVNSNIKEAVEKVIKDIFD